MVPYGKVGSLREPPASMMVPMVVGGMVVPYHTTMKASWFDPLQTLALALHLTLMQKLES